MKYLFILVFFAGCTLTLKDNPPKFKRAEIVRTKLSKDKCQIINIYKYSYEPQYRYRIRYEMGATDVLYEFELERN